MKGRNGGPSLASQVREEPEAGPAIGNRGWRRIGHRESRLARARWEKPMEE